MSFPDAKSKTLWSTARRFTKDWGSVLIDKLTFSPGSAWLLSKDRDT